ncbi:MAG: transketolase C-terminal domain-containing protein, partial [Planctomycetota bacterium]
AYDQIFHEICLQKTPCIIAIDRAGVVGADGPTHHGLFDIAYLRTLPELVVAAPKNGSEIYSLMKFALDNRLTLALRYPRERCPDSALSFLPENITLGKGEVINNGSDIAFLAYGSTVDTCLKAAELLAKENIIPTVVNMRFVKPIDRQLIYETAQKHKYIITVEEHALAGGFGSAVIEVLNDSQSLNPVNVSRPFVVHRVGIPDEFASHANREELLTHYGLDASSLVKLCKHFLRKMQGKMQGKVS